MHLIEVDMYKPYPKNPKYKVGQLGGVVGPDGHTLKPSKRKTGYLFLCIGQVTTDIHRMVAETHLGPCPEGCQVNHKNGDKTDNSVMNLEYVTHKQNMEHAKATGLIHPRLGSQHGRAKLSEADIPIIRLRCQNETQQAVADDYRVHQSLISDIVTGKKWHHVKDKS